MVRWEGEGPVTHGFVHEHLRPLHDYVIRPVIDLAHQAPVDAYELPDRLREAVRLLAPADVFPFAGTTSRNLDVDHTVAYDPTHATGPETALVHPDREPRTARPVPPPDQDPRQLDPPATLRRDLPLARPPRPLYLEDHTGTHQITPPGHHAGPARSHDPDLEIYPTDNLIEIDFPQHGLSGQGENSRGSSSVADRPAPTSAYERSRADPFGPTTDSTGAASSSVVAARRHRRRPDIVGGMRLRARAGSLAHHEKDPSSRQGPAPQGCHPGACLPVAGSCVGTATCRRRRRHEPPRHPTVSHQGRCGRRPSPYARASDVTPARTPCTPDRHPRAPGARTRPAGP